MPKIIMAVSAFVRVCFGGEGYSIIIASGTVVRNIGVLGELNAHRSSEMSIRGNTVTSKRTEQKIPARISLKIRQKRE